MPFEVNGTRDEVEAREMLLRLMGTSIEAMNNQLEEEAGGTRVSLPKTR